MSPLLALSPALLLLSIALLVLLIIVLMLVLLWRSKKQQEAEAQQASAAQDSQDGEAPKQSAPGLPENLAEAETRRSVTSALSFLERNSIGRASRYRSPTVARSRFGHSPRLSARTTRARTERRGSPMAPRGCASTARPSPRRCWRRHPPWRRAKALRILASPRASSGGSSMPE